MIKCILSTDMTQHREVCENIMGKRCGKEAGVVDESDPEERQFWLNVCLHAGDLSAQCLPWSAAAAWESRISQEFLKQAEAEKARGATPAPFMQFQFHDLKQ